MVSAADCLPRRKRHGEAEVRVVHCNAGAPHEGYTGNKTRTTKYTLLTFFPKSLYEQYRRVANIYFTLVAALSLTSFSPVRPWTTWTPLVLVLGVSMLKEAREDWKRHQADVEVNNRRVEVLNPHAQRFITKRWKEVAVGDVVAVKKDEALPADLLFLTAENEEGTCYVETMNLDGETNLKIKKAPDETKDLTHDTLTGFRGRIECEPPNSRLYQFTGNLLLEPPAVPEPLKLPINPAAVLLRGCTLRNTERAFGVVIYAGHETKIFKNSTAAPSKRSVLERVIDRIIIFMFTLLFAMCITGCVYFAFWTANRMPDHWYLDPGDVDTQYRQDQPGVVGVTNFITVFILYGYLIPISLYVTVELVKMTQSMVFINMDRDMYHEETDTPALARTSNLNEELGMVNTVLSDKTGTLTRNVMEFFKCSIAGVSYGAGVTEIERANAERRGEVVRTEPDPAAAQFHERFFNFYDKRLMDRAWHTSPDRDAIAMFFRLLAVCHTVIPDGPQAVDKIKYEAESPDEAALVVGAKVLGFFFHKRTNTSVVVREDLPDGTRDVTYEVLNILEFDSTRKRMSVIVRDDSGRIILFCKGADTVIYERLSPGHPENDKLKGVTTAHMEEYGGAGLRTLCLAYAVLDPAWYDGWQRQFLEAKTSLEDRDAKVAELAELAEKGLILLGCTAIEDKLQEGVPQCIKLLAAAGIRLWVLTGDKMETAINIGYACSLLTDEMQRFIISATAPELEALENDGKVLEAAQLGNKLVEECLSKVEAVIGKAQPGTLFAMIIDGKALSYALSPLLAKLFLRVSLQCATVICCRVSPLQKAQVTGLVRSHGDVTLAIGDGANDVGMIQRAHIGVGISGQEGMQAVMSADFAIAQFRFLTTLLLVHGRYSYKRLARMICFFFYKNLLFGTTIFTFNAFAAFSGQYIYNDFYMTLFNVVFTSLTPFVIGVFDKDVDKAMCIRHPELYHQGQHNEYARVWSIIGWLGSALWSAGVIMVVLLLGCDSTTAPRSGGQAWTMWETGVLMFSIVVVTVHLQVIQVTEQWTVMHHIAIWLSQAVWWLYLLAFGAFPISLSSDLYHLFIGVVASNPQYWLYLLVVPLTCVAPDFFLRQIKRHLNPGLHQVVQELAAQEVREAKATLGVADTTMKDGVSTLLKVFTQPPANKQTGFVPPYHKDSKFYQFIMGPLSQSQSPDGSSSGAAGPSSNPAGLDPEAGDQQPNGHGQGHHHRHQSRTSNDADAVPGSSRSPVLQHLDQEMVKQQRRLSSPNTSYLGPMHPPSALLPVLAGRQPGAEDPLQDVYTAALK